MALPLLLSVGLWLVLGAPGLTSAFEDRHRRWWVVGIIALAFWAFFSTRWSLYPVESAASAPKYTVVSLFALAAFCAGPKPRDVAVSLACGVIFQGVIVLGQVAVQHPLGLAYLGEVVAQPGNTGLGVVVAGSERWLRPYGLSLHPNIIGGYFAIGLLCMTGWLSVDAALPRWRQIVRLGVMALAWWCLLLSFSRSAWLGFGVGAVALVIIWRRGIARPVMGRLVPAVIGLVVIGGLFTLSYSRFILSRADFDGEPTEMRSISDRRVYADIALQLIVAHPVQGIGVGAFPFAAGNILKSTQYDLLPDHVHNVPLLIFAELGVVGFAIWLATWISGFVLAYRTIRDPFAVGLLAAVLAMLTISLFDHYLWSSLQFSVMLWAGMGIAIAGRN